MTNKEAIETLKSNYPSSCYSMLREAVDAAISALIEQDTKKSEADDFNKEASRMTSFTIDEIVKALRCCGQHDDNECYQCPFRGKYSFNDCAFDLYLKAASVIEDLRGRINNGN